MTYLPLLRESHVESFNSRFCDELLNRELFTGLEDARWVVDRWRLDYNHHRPHSSLDYQTPAEFAARWIIEWGKPNCRRRHTRENRSL